jgi:hypothetical protein
MKAKALKKNPCETCEIRGYSPELCKVHYKKAAVGNIPENCPHNLSVEVGKSAAVGAGVGVAATVFGLAAVPASVLKALFGHVMAVKMSAGAGGGVAGAGVSAMRKAKEEKERQKQKKKKKARLPLIA